MSRGGGGASRRGRGLLTVRAPARGRPLAEGRSGAHAPCPPAARFIGVGAGGPGAGMVRLLELLVLLRAVRPLPTPTSAPGNGSLAQCSPEQFHCSEPRDPQTDCYPLEWLCDGHPDCDDGRDEWGCGASESPAVPTAGGTETSAVPVPGRALPSRNHGRMWMLIVAVLLSCLVAVGGIAAWGKSKAKSRSDIFGLESVSREQLVPDKSQADLFS